MHPVLQELTDAFTRQHPNVLFTLRGGGSALGEEQAATGRVNLAASTLFPPETPLPGAARLVRIPIGVDGLAIIVHSSNPVAGLTLDQLQQLYSGMLLDWSEVNGEMGSEVSQVELVSREDGSGSRRLFEEQVMRGEPVSLTAVVMPTSRDVVDYVAKTPLAIGYVSRGLVMNLARTTAATPVAATNTVTNSIPTPGATDLPSVRVVPVDGQLPTLDTLRSRQYPLIQPLYLISRGETRGGVRQFVDFVLSPAGQAIVRRYHLPVR
jgi:phosphate transport system substrate-binding protein